MAEIKTKPTAASAEDFLKGMIEAALKAGFFGK
jgi:hypothetical protein